MLRSCSRLSMLSAINIASIYISNVIQSFSIDLYALLNVLKRFLENNLNIEVREYIPVRTHLCILTALVFSSTLICTFWFQYELSIYWMFFVFISVFRRTSKPEMLHSIKCLLIIYEAQTYIFLLFILHQNLCCHY